MSSRPNFALAGENPQHFGLEASLTYVWDVGTLTWVKSTGGGGGGGAVTVADGADVAEGSTTDVAWVAGAGTVISLLKKIASAGGSAVSIADAADVVEGALADAAIITDTTGTVNGKLRGLVKHAFERMPAALGQGTMAQSLPIVVASNQSAVPVSGTVAVTSAGLTNLDVALSTRTKPADQQHAIIDSSALPTGAATLAGQTQPGVDIGDVTVNNAAGAAAVNIQDGGNTITVDGTVAVTSAGLTNLDVALSTRLKPADTLTGVTTVGTVTTVTNPVTVAQGTAGSTDWRMDLRRGLTLTFAAIDVASSGDNTIVAADGTKKIKVLSYSLVVDAAVNAKWKSGAATSLTGAMNLAANGGLSDGGGSSPGTQWILQTAVNEALVLNLSGAVGARGRVTYFLEA